MPRKLKVVKRHQGLIPKGASNDLDNLYTCTYNLSPVLHTLTLLNAYMGHVGWSEFNDNLSVHKPTTESALCTQWQHQGGHGGKCPQVGGCPPTCPPQSEEKNGQNQLFSAKFWIIAPSESHFAPSKKIFWCRHCVYMCFWVSAGHAGFVREVLKDSDRDFTIYYESCDVIIKNKLEQTYKLPLQ